MIKAAQLGLLLLGLLACACTPAVPPGPGKQPYNVLFIAIDDLRPELGAYGETHMVTPNLDRLAAEGRLFRNHYVQAPTCGAIVSPATTTETRAPSFSTTARIPTRPSTSPTPTRTS